MTSATGPGRDPGEELVYVVPRSAVIDGPGWRGVRVDRAAEVVAGLAGIGRFERRAAAEDDPTHKQVIPYLVLRDGPRWFLMRRTRAGMDVRLHDRWSIGVGGHLNRGDWDLAGGLRREWNEELRADFVPEFRFVGLLNDDDSDVGRVHLGVVFVADAAGRAVEIRETEKLSGSFVATAEVLAVHDHLETWSQLVFDHLSSVGDGFEMDG